MKVYKLIMQKNAGNGMHYVNAKTSNCNLFNSFNMYLYRGMLKCKGSKKRLKTPNYL